MPAAAITRDVFGRLADGREVPVFTLTAGGLTLCAIALGGIVTQLLVPDRRGRVANVVLGFDGLHDYAMHNPNFGVIVGRYGNRIAGGRFTLDGRAHQLPCNDGPNCLHGGPQGFGKRLWQAEPLPPAGDGSVALQLAYTSEDGEEGFPGRLQTRVRYTLGPDASWSIDYEATTDMATVVNLTHHDYFNLAGSGSGSALGHELTIAASRYTEVDEQLIPQAIAAVAGTPFDFRQPTRIEARIRQGHPQLRRGRGYDHNWLLDATDTDAQGLHHAARLHDPTSGRTLSISTSEPALQFYSGNFLDGRLCGSGGQIVRQGDGLCLETQHSPDSPNRPEWPSTVLRPGQVFRSRTRHRFSLD